MGPGLGCFSGHVGVVRVTDTSSPAVTMRCASARTKLCMSLSGFLTHWDGTLS